MRPLWVPVFLTLSCLPPAPSTPACKAVVTGAVNETLSCSVWIVVDGEGAKLSFGGLGAGSVVQLHGGMTFPMDLEPKDYTSPTGGSDVVRGPKPVWEQVESPDLTIGTSFLHVGSVGDKVTSGGVTGRQHATGQIKLSMEIDPAYGSGSTVDVDLTFTDSTVVPGTGFEGTGSGGGAGGGSGGGSGGGGGGSSGGGSGGGGGGSSGGGEGGGTGAGGGGGATSCRVHLSGARTGDFDCILNAIYAASDDLTSLLVATPGTNPTNLTQQLIISGRLAARTYTDAAPTTKTECAAYDPVTFASWNEQWYADQHSAPLGTLSETITSPGTTDSNGVISGVHGSLTATLPALAGTPSSGTVEVSVTF